MNGFARSSLVRRALDSFFGAGEAAVTVPSMDGALLPNDALDQAVALATLPAPDNLAGDGRRVFLSSGNAVLALDGDSPSPVAGFDSAVSCLAAHPDGGLAVGLNAGGLVIRGGRHDGRSLDRVGDQALTCPVAAAFADGDTLLLCLGSRRHAPDLWARDLMERGSSGSVWRIDLASGKATALALDLAFPFGIALAADGSIIVAESWRHRLLALRDGRSSVVLDNLPAYPSRLAADPRGGGLWLSLLAPRRQLVEFILREPAFRKRMLQEIDAALWMAPALSSGRTFREPLQGGAVKQLGVLKPWAPTRSYGLLVKLDEKHQPKASYHSRADGGRHGITSCLVRGDRVLATSKGGDALIALDDER